MLVNCSKVDQLTILGANPKMFSFDNGGGSHTFEVICETDWIIERSNLSEWLTVTPSSSAGDTTVEITATENTTTEALSVTLSIVAEGAKTVEIKVTQHGRRLDIIYFEDENFKNELLNVETDHVPTKIDANDDGEISFEEAEKVKTINVLGRQIVNISEIKYFTELTRLRCDFNEIRELDVSNNTKLLILICDANKLESIDISALTELDWLQCSNNFLTKLDVSNNPKLTGIQFFNNSIDAISVVNNPILELLRFANNSIVEVDLTKSKKITNIDFSGNEINVLDISKNIDLESVSINRNKITEFTVSHLSKLTYLDVSQNKIKSLDITKNSVITKLLCGVQTNNNDEKVAIELKLTKEQYDKETIFDAKDINNANVECEIQGGTPPPTDNVIVFADEKFKIALLNNTLGHSPAVIDTNGDGDITTSEAAIVTKLMLSSSDLTNLSGITNFTSLAYIDFSSNHVSNVDLSKNILLETLIANDSHLLAINIDENVLLKDVRLNDNLYFNINISKNIEIKNFEANGNDLTMLDVSKNTELITLDCSQNMISTLNITSNRKLTSVICGNHIRFVPPRPQSVTIDLTMTQAQNDAGIFDSALRNNDNVNLIIQ